MKDEMFKYAGNQSLSYAVSLWLFQALPIITWTL